MELITILLITVEVVIVSNSLIGHLQCLIRDGPELRYMLFNRNHKGHSGIVEIWGEPLSPVVTKTA